MEQRDASVGIDVAKEKLDVFLDATGEHFTVRNDEAGVEEARRRIAAVRPFAVVVEHSGGYERRCALDLMDAGLPVVLVNPGRIRDFARSKGQRAKNDRIDARMLAEFGRERRPAASERPTDKRLELDELVGRRRQLVAMRAAERTRAAQARSPRVRDSIAQLIRGLDREVAGLEERIAAMIEDDDDWRGRARLLRSVPGVGPAVAATLVAELPELGGSNRQRIAALVGLAPHDNDSGPMRGRRTCRGGRSQVRAKIYMAVITAKRCNPVISELAKRLTAAGKPFKVVMVACMRKMLSILNSIIARGTPWNEKRIVNA